MNTAIIVAAGTGSRFGSENPKQFIELLGKPLIEHTLDRFEECSAVDETVLVLAEDRIEEFGRRIRSCGHPKLVQVVPGGQTRAESVKNGLAVIDPSEGVIAVHDGARPLVPPADIAATIARAVDVGAACLVARVVDTIKHVEDGFIAGTLDRGRLRRALTPQAFRYDILKRAFEDADLSESVTDECSLVERLSIPIAVVEGDPRNIKVTHREDLAVAELYLKQWRPD